MKTSHYLVHVFAIMALAGCASGRPGNFPNLSTQANLSQEHGMKEYKFGVGDVFDVKFFENAELDQTITVRPDGRISLPLVEEVLVVGLTPSELDKIITEKYSEKIKEPEVTIVLKQFAAQKVYIGGEVFNPGVIQLTGRMTLLQSIFNAGGFRRSAKLNSVLLIRNNNNRPDLYTVDVDKILDTGGDDILLQPYDMVFLPKTLIAKADDFVDQYINQIIPEVIRVNFGFSYALNEREIITEKKN